MSNASALNPLASRYQYANRDHLIQRLLLKKWSILNEIEQFIIHISEHYFDYYAPHDNSSPPADPSPAAPASGSENFSGLDANLLALLKQQNALRSRGHHHLNILQTSKHIDALRALSSEELNEVLHDFDTLLRDIRQLIAAQHGALLFTAIPISETVNYLLKGYHTISQY